MYVAFQREYVRPVTCVTWSVQILNFFIDLSKVRLLGSTKVQSRRARVVRAHFLAERPAFLQNC